MKLVLFIGFCLKLLIWVGFGKLMVVNMVGVMLM